MIKIKKKTEKYLRTVYLSSVVLFCLIVGFFGMATAYENIRQIGFGEYRQAVEYKDGTLMFFDFQVDLK